jgi:hypothetical protein
MVSTEFPKARESNFGIIIMKNLNKTKEKRKEKESDGDFPL